MTHRYPERMRTPTVILLAVFMSLPAPSSAFSVLGHQAVVDNSWDSSIVPELRRRFPDAGAEDVKKADVSTADFEKEFGKSYREPGYFAKFFAFLVKLVPNWGPFERSVYKPLPPDVQKLYVDALEHAGARYRATVAQVRDRRFELPDFILDTGKPAQPGEYEPADEAYLALLEKLDEKDFKDVPPAMRDDLRRFFENGGPPAVAKSSKVREAVARLDQSDGRR